MRPKTRRPMSSKNEPETPFTTRYPAGTMLFEENDPGSRMYVISVLQT